jgi:signal transduction histidine kinase
MEIDFKSDDLPSSVPPEISLCLFRVLQEALHNAAKHSGVRQFDVQLKETANEIHLTVSDCGVGFNLETARKAGGLGLNHMQERLKLVKGSFSIDSQPNRGTTIHARVPQSWPSAAARAGRNEPLLQWLDDGTEVDN